ncbi:rab effector MyRIP isoform X2 [Petromyzon marinus]|uniref:rab effector MyRIP isoform X2 n=1 Tax=Petromyzon marinus TaxID=7757 RepID=UPI003F724A20
MGRKLDLSGLTEDEARLVLRVVERDGRVRQRETERLNDLKQRLVEEESKRVILSRQNNFNERHCIRCCVAFYSLLNAAHRCLDCCYNVCSRCALRSESERGWRCRVCVDTWRLRVLSLDWFYEGVKARFKHVGSTKVARQLQERLCEGGGEGTTSSLANNNDAWDSAESAGLSGGTPQRLGFRDGPLGEVQAVVWRVAYEAVLEAIRRTELHERRMDSKSGLSDLQGNTEELVQELASSLAHKLLLLQRQPQSSADSDGEHRRPPPLTHSLAYAEAGTDETLLPKADPVCPALEGNHGSRRSCLHGDGEPVTQRAPRGPAEKMAFASPLVIDSDSDTADNPAVTSHAPSDEAYSSWSNSRADSDGSHYRHHRHHHRCRSCAPPLSRDASWSVSSCISAGTSVSAGSEFSPVSPTSCPMPLLLPGSGATAATVTAAVADTKKKKLPANHGRSTDCGAMGCRFGAVAERGFVASHGGDGRAATSDGGRGGVRERPGRLPAQFVPRGSEGAAQRPAWKQEWSRQAAPGPVTDSPEECREHAPSGTNQLAALRGHLSDLESSLCALERGLGSECHWAKTGTRSASAPELLCGAAERGWADGLQASGDRPCKGTTGSSSTEEEEDDDDEEEEERSSTVKEHGRRASSSEDDGDLEVIEKELRKRCSAASVSSLTAHALRLINTAQQQLVGVAASPAGCVVAAATSPRALTAQQARVLDSCLSLLEEDVYVGAGGAFQLETELRELEQCTRGVHAHSSDADIAMLEGRVASAAAQVQRAEGQISDIEEQISSLDMKASPEVTQRKNSQVPVEMPKQRRRKLPVPPDSRSFVESDWKLQMPSFMRF